MNKNVIILGKECNNNNNSIPDFIYRDLNNKKSIQYQIVQENSNDWKIYFYESGTLTFLHNKPEYLDVFLVGGGSSSDAGGGDEQMPGSGGAGGFTSRGIIKLGLNDNDYQIIIGDGGISTGSTGQDGKPSSAFGLIAKGGIAPKKDNNYIGQGGSGGGGYNKKDGETYINWTGADGGSDGKNGSGTDRAGQGQGFTTREFYEPNGTLYAGGGGGASSATNDAAGGKGGEGGGGHGSDRKNIGMTSGLPNTGGGGGACNYSKTTAGGSGIVVIRNLRNS